MGSTLSVGYFENLTKNQKFDWLTYGITDILIGELSMIPDLQVVERTKLNEILKELNLGLTDLVDTSLVPKAGKLLGAANVVIGSYIVQKEITLMGRVVDTETGMVVYSLKKSGKKREINKIINSFAAGLAKHFGSSSPLSSVYSFETFDVYSRGVKLFEDGKYKQAQQSFSSILKVNPDFLAAGDNLSRCFEQLKQFKKLRYQREINMLFTKIKRARNFIAQKGYTTPLAKWISAFNRKFPKPDKAQKKYYDTMLIIRSHCTTPGQGIWNIMHDLGEIGDKQLEYFQDTVAFRNYKEQAIALGKRSLPEYSRDAFLSEIEYIIISYTHQLTIYFDERRLWQEVKMRSEIFLKAFPDYRLIEFIEDWYEEALNKLSG